MNAASLVACAGIIVDAKDEGAEKFYGKYDFVTVSGESWPHRMFLPLGTAEEAFADAEQEGALDELASEAQKHGLGT